MIDSLLAAIRSEVFGGIVASSVVVSLLYLLKNLPAGIWEFVTWRLTCELVVFNEDAAFDRVSEWLSRHQFAQRCRKLRLTTRWDEAERADVERLSPGIGLHLFWYRGRPVIARRWLPDKNAVGYGRLEDIRLTTIGGSPQLLQELVAEIRESRHNMRGNTVDVFLYRRRWRLACRRPKRGMDTVILPEQQKRTLVADVEAFLGSRQWYVDHAIPYRRGYLFEGPPGAGKTSLAMALASCFSRPIYALNLGSIGCDDDLIEAVSEVPEHAILLIEDIDAARAAASRDRSSPTIVNGVSMVTDEEPKEVTLSGLLNVIDGVLSREGRILIMTTNHPDKVDPALLRPGRADRREHIGPLDKPEILAMCRRFFDDAADAAEFAETVAAPIAAAELQEMLLQTRRQAEQLRRVA